VIVKIQLSLSSTDPDAPRKALFENEAKSISVEMDASPELIALVQDNPKTFWEAILEGDMTGAQNLSLQYPVPPEEW
jgi:hypothetical protein